MTEKLKYDCKFVEAVYDVRRFTAVQLLAVLLAILMFQAIWHTETQAQVDATPTPTPKPCVFPGQRSFEPQCRALMKLKRSIASEERLQRSWTLRTWHPYAEFNGLLPCDWLKPPRFGCPTAWWGLSGNDYDIIGYGQVEITTMWMSRVGYKDNENVPRHQCDEGLDGELPADPTVWTALRHLEWVDFSCNDIRGRIPVGMYQLEQMHILALNDNLLTGSIPGELFAADLHELYLQNNYLSGNIPKEIGNACRLDKFGRSRRWLCKIDLSNNALTGNIPAELGQIKHERLQLIDLSDNHLTGSIPKGLGDNLPYWYLDLRNNDLTGSIPPDFATGLSNFDVRTILLSGNHGLTGCVPHHLQYRVDISETAYWPNNKEEAEPKLPVCDPLPTATPTATVSSKVRATATAEAKLTRAATLAAPTATPIATLDLTDTRLHTEFLYFPYLRRGH